MISAVQMCIGDRKKGMGFWIIFLMEKRGGEHVCHLIDLDAGKDSLQEHQSRYIANSPSHDGDKKTDDSRVSKVQDSTRKATNIELGEIIQSGVQEDVESRRTRGEESSP
jgi:hypothetical protein